MNNQKFFLLTAIALSIFLLWDKWQIKQNPPQQNQITQTGQNSQIVNTGNASNGDIPSVVATNNGNVPTLTPNIATTNKKTIKINTDLLEVLIDENSAIVGAKLKAYPKTLGSTDVVEMLANRNDKFYIIQGGLAPQESMPTHLAKWQTSSSEYNLDNDSLVVPFVWEKGGVKVIKNFRFSKDSYQIKVDYQIQNNTNKDINILSYNRLNRHKIDQHSMMMPTFSGGAHFSDEEIYEKFEFDDFSDGNALNTKGGWAGLIEHYFVSAIIPNQNQQNSFKTKVLGNQYILENTSPAVNIPANSTQIVDSADFYVGPKEKARIDSAVKGLDHAVDYSWLYIIAMPLAELLYWIFSLVGSWGLAIILLTILIKLAFYKLSEKSYKSMAGMRKLAPRMEHLKATYGDDKQKMGQKTMELYKEAKVNPASGCLPIVVQMPVFISLYWVLIEMVELRQTPFLYLPDLSAQDPYYILPIVMGVSMFIQQKLNPKPTDPMQAKIMMALPLVFTVFFLWFPSGLVLYWVLNNILSIAQQWYINKKIEG
jgi:YidC/Oxa1 family membrane protein insertase